MNVQVNSTVLEKSAPNNNGADNLFSYLSLDLAEENRQLENKSPEERVTWALGHFRSNIILSSSFGAQSAVMLHMVVQQNPNIPVVLIDTGYLFEETYQFVDELTERLSLNLEVFRSKLSPAWQESRFGKLWEQDVEGITQYNQMNKVEPMSRALEELNAHGWIAGLRRLQSSGRQNLPVLVVSQKRLKIHPIIDWTDKDVYLYLKKHDLPYHPLWEKGYPSIGDTHTTHQLTEGMSLDDTRFFGLKRECGLHENVETNFEI